MTERRRYLYRLDVTYPPRSHPSMPDHDETWWPNGEKAPTYVDTDWDTGAKTDVQEEFRWPTRRVFLSRSGADHRASILRGFGAIVTVVRSKAVEW